MDTNDPIDSVNENFDDNNDSDNIYDEINDDDFNYYDDECYDADDTFIVSDLEEIEVDKLTRLMNEYFVLLNDFIEEIKEDCSLKEYFKERNEIINKIKDNFTLLCSSENNQYIIENSVFLKELKQIIVKTIEDKEIKLLAQKADVVLDRYEHKLRNYEVKLQIYERQKKNNSASPSVLNKLRQDLEECEKKTFF